jgi:hypothetical protein
VSGDGVQLVLAHHLDVELTRLVVAAQVSGDARVGDLQALGWVLRVDECQCGGRLREKSHIVTPVHGVGAIDLQRARHAHTLGGLTRPRHVGHCPTNIKDIGVVLLNLHKI